MQETTSGLRVEFHTDGLDGAFAWNLSAQVGWWWTPNKSAIGSIMGNSDCEKTKQGEWTMCFGVQGASCMFGNTRQRLLVRAGHHKTIHILGWTKAERRPPLEWGHGLASNKAVWLNHRWRALQDHCAVGLKSREAGGWTPAQ